jgi:hypothetical protein
MAHLFSSPHFLDAEWHICSKTESICPLDLPTTNYDLAVAYCAIDCDAL